MPSSQHNIVHKHSGTQLTFAILLAVLASGLVGCSKPAPPPAEQAKRYHLVGKVVSIDLQQGSLNVDGQDIPGFMSAMMMSYPVHDAKILSTLSPGDEISADVVLVSSDNSYYLENIVVTKKGAGGSAPTGTSNQPQPGEKVPDFALVNQDGKRIHLNSYKGDVLLVTFIYTRCPFPDFCPLVSKNFANIYAQLQKNPPANSKRIRLLSVSFDPAYDTPAVLKKYAATFSGTTGGAPFDRWEFATVPAKELPKVADFFGLYYNESGGQIVHSLSTTVISPDGTIFKWYQDSDWEPADLLTDAAQSLQQENQHNAHAPAAIPTA